MTKAINVASIEKATGRKWDDWATQLHNLGADDFSHLELSKLVKKELEGLVDNPDWWSQSITVAYEQSIGKRIPGQLANGLFELAVSKAVTEPREALFLRSVEWFENNSEHNGKVYINPRQTITPKRSNWRCDFNDGSKFAVTVEGDDTKSKLVLSHTAVPDYQSAEQWKAHWKSVVDILINAS